MDAGGDTAGCLGLWRETVTAVCGVTSPPRVTRPMFACVRSATTTSCRYPEGRGQCRAGCHGGQSSSRRLTFAPTGCWWPMRTAHKIVVSWRKDGGLSVFLNTLRDIFISFCSSASAIMQRIPSQPARLTKTGVVDVFRGGVFIPCLLLLSRLIRWYID